MPRPVAITNDQIIVWENEIAQDPFLGNSIYLDPLFKEVLLAGKYLTQQLLILQCSEDLIGRITFTAGQLSFGRDDPWEIAEDLIVRYQQNTLVFEE